MSGIKCLFRPRYRVMPDIVNGQQVYKVQKHFASDLWEDYIQFTQEEKAEEWIKKWGDA